MVVGSGGYWIGVGQVVRYSSTCTCVEDGQAVGIVH